MKIGKQFHDAKKGDDKNETKNEINQSNSVNTCIIKMSIFTKFLNY